MSWTRVGAAIRPGVTTLELDKLAGDLIRAAGGIPSFIGVPGTHAPYKHSLCISIDSEIVHGVPGKRRIAEGQIVSVDAGAIVDGWHGDGARSWIVGEVPDTTRQLVEVTRQAMYAGIAAAQPGGFLGDIGAAIEDVALEHGYGVVRSFVGHGIGTEMHEEPQVTNFRSGNRGRRIEPGLCLAIEPMFTLGGHEVHVRDRRLDRRDPRRQPGGPLGALDGGHRERARHPDRQRLIATRISRSLVAAGSAS